MGTDDELWPWDRIDALVETRASVLAAHYGLLYVPDGHGLPSRCATATLVEYHGRRFILTAAHVAREHADAPTVFAHNDLDASGAPMVRHYSHGRHVTLTMWPTVIDDEADVALIEAPADVRELAGLIWFDLEAEARRAEEMRRFVAAHPRRDLAEPSVPMIVLGYASFAKVAQPERGVLALAGGAMPCAPRGWDDPVCGRRPAQLHLEIWPPDLEHIGGLPPLEQTIHRQLDKWDDADDAFGGYSGGPVVAICRNASVLVATVKEGHRFPDESRMIATPIGETLELLTRGGN